MNNKKLIRLEGLIRHLATKIEYGEEHIMEDDNISCAELIDYLNIAKEHYEYLNKPMPCYVDYV